jgi:hypothetical protein
VSGKITYSLWRSEVDIDRTAKCNDGLFRVSSTPDLTYAPNDLFLVYSLSSGIIVPAKNPHIGTAFSLRFKETTLLKPVHNISLLSNPFLHQCLAARFAIIDEMGFIAGGEQ